MVEPKARVAPRGGDRPAEAGRGGDRPAEAGRAGIRPVGAAPSPVAAPRRIYAVNPLLIGPLPAWDGAFAHAASLGFDTVLLPPPFAPGPRGTILHLGDPDRPHPALAAPDALGALARLAEMARANGLALMLHLDPARVAAEGAFAAAHPHWFEDPWRAAPPDPRRPPAERGTLRPRWEDQAVQEALGGWWEARLRLWAEAGVAGFRADAAPDAVPPALWARWIAALPGADFLAWVPGVPAEAVARLAGLGFAGVFDSLAWWDLREGWLAEEHARLAAVAPAVLATVEAPFGPRLAAAHDDPRLAASAARRHLLVAAGIGGGLLVPMGFEHGARRAFDPAQDRPGDWTSLSTDPPGDLRKAVRAANAVMAARPGTAGEVRPLTGPGAPVTALLRAEGARDARDAPGATLVLANPDLLRPVTVEAASLLPGAGGPFGRFRPRPAAAGTVPGEGQALGPGASLTLQPGGTLLLEAEAPRPILGPVAALAAEAAGAPRLAIEAIEPAVEAGRFPVKRIVGEIVEVSADLFMDGHERMAAALLWRAADEEAWREVPMRPLGNDRWAAAFPLERMGRHAFAIEAWYDAFQSFREGLEKKHAAGQDVTLELEEGRLLVAAMADRAGGDLAGIAAALRGADAAERLRHLLDPATAALMAAADARPHRVRSAEFPLDAERSGARFAAWYELFPRSQSGDRNRHGTFADVIRRLPHIRSMGFDVLYVPPIHPIGQAFRKGRNNTLDPAPEDPGSPYAIGSAEGGHDAIHPALGTLEDFRALVAASRDHGLELALDFAIQCSPDHPWLRRHKGWFDWRPDGSIKYAENPPKKYQDIVNVDFYAPDAVPGLWVALRDVVLFWVEQGVKLFRVDNPHTKPFPFWEWLIAEVRGHHPDVVFLSEAFTRPKVMYRLAKLGFSQSYTYFTWRNAKAEIEDYLTELNQAPQRDFFRPHFFVNTPDINPTFLQQGGRAAHLIRAALATTLSGLWGMYQGFELCEATPLAPGREEYLDSDKYEIKVWPDRRPGDIVEEITRLNLIRRANPALQTHLGLAFHRAVHDDVLWYRKATADRSNVILCAVGLDPRAVMETEVELPLWEWGLPDDAALEAEDLMRGHRFTWRGKAQRLRLDPRELPFGLWRVRPAGGAA